MASTLIVTVEPASLTMQAGGESAARITIENRSQFVGQYQLAVAGVEAGWAVFDPEQVAAFPGGTTSATIRLRAPASALPATYPAVIRVINQNDPSEETRALLKLAVQASATVTPPVPPPLPETRATRTAPPQPIHPFSGAPALRGASPGAGQLEFALDRDSLMVLPGSRQQINMNVRNTGGTNLVVELAAQGLPPAWLSLTPASVELPPTQTAGARLVIAPSADAPTGSYPIALIATDRDNPVNVVRLDLVVEIGEAGGLLVELIPAQAEGQAGADFRVRVTQSGTTAVNVSLEASDSEGALTYTFNPATVYAPPGGEGISQLSVRARRGLAGVESRTFPFTITATAIEGTARATTAQGRFVQKRTPAIALNITPGEVRAPDQATYTLRLGNPSQIETTVRLSAGDANAACRYQINPAALTIPAGGEAQVTLVVTPLQLSADLGQLIHNFTVRAEPSGELLTAAQIDGKFIQTAMTLPSIALTPSSQSSSGSANYAVQVSNPRATPLDVELLAYDEANMVALKLNPEKLRLPANGKAQAKLNARPTTNLLSGESRRPNEFTVEVRVPGLERGTTAQGTLVQVAGFNFGRFVPLIVGVLLLLVLCWGALQLVAPLRSFLDNLTGQAGEFVKTLPTPLAAPTLLPPTPTPVPPTPTTFVGPFQVMGATAKVSPTSANACPATFTFSADIEVNRAGTLTYVWEFSDGSSTPPKTINFGGAGKQTVSESKSFNVNGVVGGHVKVTVPPSPDSNQATANLNCPAAPTAPPPPPPPPPTSPPPPPTPAGPAVGNFGGQWVHNFGTMNLTQSGASVTGTYLNGFANASGTVAGTVTGNTFNGTWSISGGTGSIQWTLGAGGQTFTGKWNNTSEWCGSRAGVDFPSGCGFSGAWSIRLQNGTRTMNMTQKGTTVTGTYFNGTNNGTVNGTVSFTGGNVSLSGTWTVPSASTSGPFRFYLLDYDGKQFRGNYNTTFEWCGFREGAAQPSPCLRN